MLQTLQETRQTAQTISARTGVSLNKSWQTEFKKLYPDLNVEWKGVLSRYNYHFGNLDTIGQTPQPREPVTGKAYFQRTFY